MRETLSRRHQRQAGISLYTLLAAVVILSVLTTTIVTSYTGENAQGSAAYTLMNSVGQAALRFRNDTGCYPKRPTALFDLDDAQSYNTCGYAIAEQAWAGPYIRFHDATTAGALKLSDFGPTAQLALRSSISGHSVTETIVLKNLPQDVAKLTYATCGGDGSNCSMTNSGKLRDVSQVYDRKR